MLVLEKLQGLKTVSTICHIKDFINILFYQNDFPLPRFFCTPIINCSLHVSIKKVLWKPIKKYHQLSYNPSQFVFHIFVYYSNTSMIVVKQQHQQILLYCEIKINMCRFTHTQLIGSESWPVEILLFTSFHLWHVIVNVKL